ncbi:hypothetical protein LTR37_010712 [Vermiconidia calcicola]|uniref:Uncharacterized protein n=1 Tax=Vermiconidia calcicola TaxID=1690605 RepID=A0ACC3N5A6_9PEZI|nr:hypothetical protein LTR37_010712 [Vermiconidia calcicola]
MNVEDADIVWAERDTSPTRFRSYDPNDQLVKEYERVHAERGARSRSPAGSRPSAERREPVEEVEEVEPIHSHGSHARGSNATGSRNSSSASSISTVERVETRDQPGSRSRRRHMSTISKASTGMEQDMMSYLDRHPTAVERIEAHRLQHSQTVGSTRAFSREGIEIPDFGGGKPFPPPLPEREEYVVQFSGFDDPRHAQNFKFSKKLIISCILVFDSLAATFASSIFSAASTAVGEEFNVGREVVTLGTSFFVLGYALGPLVFAPLSELYGRRVPIIIASFGFSIFNTAVAVSKDYQTLVISRFFSGIFGSCPLTLCGAVFADMYDNKTRGLAIACFSATLMNGPFCGPMVGGFLTKSYLGWRWVAWIPAFMGYASTVLAMFFQEETYGPVILVAKASELRRLTRNWGIHAKQEEVEVDLKELAIKNITRPLRILFTEPIVLIVTTYMSFIYGLLYLNLTAYALVYQQVYGWSLGVAGLPFMALIVGVMIGFFIIVFMNKSYVKKLEANNNIPVPEWRLPLPMAGGIFFAAGLIWFGWAGYMASTPWIVSTLAGIFIGFGIFTVFLQCLNYIIDAYLMFSASAIAANTLMRSLFGAIFPLFATYMFEGMGIEWAMTFLGCVAALFIPMPFILYKYGKSIRARSKFAPAPDIEQDKRRDLESRGKTESDGNGTSSSSEAKELEEKKDD